MMYKDILQEIGKFANIDLINYQYICDHCNDKISHDQMICCVYHTVTSFQTSFNPEIEIYRTVKNYKNIYTCPDCYDSFIKYHETCIVFPNLLDIESLEILLEDVVDIARKKILKECIMNNISITQANNRILFTFYEFKLNKIIEHTFLYDNDEPFEKYFQRLSKSCQKYLNDFKIKEYFKLCS